MYSQLFQENRCHSVYLNKGEVSLNTRAKKYIVVRGGLVDGPHAYQDQFRGSKHHRVYTEGVVSRGWTKNLLCSFRILSDAKRLGIVDERRAETAVRVARYQAD